MPKRYRFVDLGLPPPTVGRVRRVGTYNTAVGHLWSATEPTTAFQSNLGALALLPSLPPHAEAIGIAHGLRELVAGRTAGHPVVWVDGQPVDLRPFLGDASGAAWDVNPSGVVCRGSGSDSGTHGTAIPFRLDLVTHQVAAIGIPGLDPIPENAARGINATGVVVGDLNTRAFRHDGGVTTDVTPAGATAARAWDIDDAGTIVGEAWFGDYADVHRPFRRTPNGSTVDLTPPEVRAAAYAINNEEEIVGRALLPGTDGIISSCAVLFEGGTVHDLNHLVDGVPPGFRLESATGINDRGTIVGRGKRSDLGGGERPFMLVENPWVRVLDRSLVDEILYGVLEGGGGRLRSGRRIPPWGPVQRAQRDLVEVLAMQVLAGGLEDRETRRLMEHASLDAMERVVTRLRELLREGERES
jgi:hypothetical protein